jgi:NDP-sugar pyrophosphorylase family protein
MKAMILAAGLGTRLRPLTNDRPKALVEVGGRTLLEIALARLRWFGVNEVIVNAHHFAGMVLDYLKTKNKFGMRIEVSREEELLDTGGGLKKAAWFFEGSDEPFVLHNVDVISDIDLGRMVRFHSACNALATLAVQARESSRYLLFDENGDLCGRRAVREGKEQIARSAQTMEPLAFAGIHVISPRIFGMLEETDAFSIVNAYLRLAATGERIVAYRANRCYWKDLGRPENVAQAAEDLASGSCQLS